MFFILNIKKILKSSRAFTLVEILMVIAVLSIIAVVVLMIINPLQLMRQSRDGNRIAELQAVNKALLYFQGAGGLSMGDHNVVYISLPSDQADCSDLGLPSPGAGYTYACKPSSTYRNTDGTGWIPVDFTAYQGTLGNMFSNLPIDPINTVSGSYFYSYINGSWALSTTLESEKYLESLAVNDGGTVDTKFEIGNNLALNDNLPDVEEGLPSPAVTSITPNLGDNSDSISITNLAGTSFQEGASFKLTKSGQSDIVCTSVVYVSPIKLTGTCDLTGHVAGGWNVVVTNPDGKSGTLAAGFAVNGYNVSGYAWSETIGWVSFNCINNSTCGIVNYGVDVDSVTGIFSGYAWSENVGWIAFGVSDLTGCPSGVCEAKVTGGLSGEFPKSVTGWAKILSSNLWIHLSGTAQDESTYGVQVASDGSFSGYGWEPDLAGWLHFTGTFYNVLVSW